MDYLTLCAIVKQEAPYIKEWIDFHKIVGVDHFYIYDNESEDNLIDVLKPYIEDKTVTYRKIAGKSMQLCAYFNCLYRHEIESRWIGFIDIDEFIVPTNGQTLSDFLVRFEGFGALVINWLIYGSSGYISKPSGLVTKNFVYRANKSIEANKYIKSIIDPQRLLGLDMTPHSFYYKNGIHAVNEKFESVEGSFSDHNSTDDIRINHYFTKSREEFIQKISRGRADCSKIRLLDEFEEADRNEVYDPVVINLWNE